MRQRDSIGELAQQQGREGGKGDLANGLMLTVLIDDGEVASGALGQFVEILVSTWLHQRDAVDLHSLGLRLGPKVAGPGVRTAGNAIGHEADDLGRRTHPKGHFDPLVPGGSRGEGCFLHDAPGIRKLLG